jgi:hypothetical protein
MRIARILSGHRPDPACHHGRMRRPRILGGPGGDRLPAAPVVNADGRPTRPDKLSIWPTEDETFGIDVLYLGPQGHRRAQVVHRQIEEAGLASALRREGENGWIVRFGPVSREDMLTVLNGYVW